MSADTSASTKSDQDGDDRTTAPRRGILVANLGSPDRADEASVRRYLNEFLMDRRVLDVPWLIRRFIVSAFILPSRPKQTARAYQSIWTDAGSPLITYTTHVADAIGEKTGLPTAVGMRYGNPSLADALASLGDVDEIVLLALYPQHADSSRQTTIARTQELAGHRSLLAVPPYFSRSDYIDALVRHVESQLPASAEHLLLSYHGLPERHLTKTDPTGSHCLKSDDCCSKPSPAHATCYRHQCFETSRLLGARLPIDHSVSFQSRLGRLPWLTPYTEERIAELAKSGVRHLAVTCPAFAVDNLETLEEIGMRGAEIFRDNGGGDFTLIPALNDLPEWMDVLASWLTEPSESFEIVAG